jgi:hypothetical protein
MCFHCASRPDQNTSGPSDNLDPTLELSSIRFCIDPRAVHSKIRKANRHIQEMPVVPNGMSNTLDSVNETPNRLSSYL